MNQFLKSLSILLISLSFCFLSYFFCMFIAEKYFFDKFFYRKSSVFGYNYYSSPQPDFGERNIYLSKLTSIDSSHLLETIDDDQSNYIISIIGDSYVWGQGIKNKQRFSKLLENKLNKIRPTKVISIGEIGNNSLEYLQHYDQIKKLYNSNLYIFTLVYNDAFINQGENQYYPEYYSIINQCQEMYPDIKPVYEIYEYLMNQGYDFNQDGVNEIISKAHDESWKNPINICIEKEISARLPTQNSLYFFADYYTDDNQNYSVYKNILSETNKTIIDSRVAKNYPKYKKYLSQDNIYDNFIVSQKETHPNALANQMYADILFNEITTNPKFGF